jgi:phytoene/squalene synthetase
VFGRESLREFIGGEQKITRDFIRDEQRKSQDFFREAQRRTDDLIRRQDERARADRHALEEFTREILFRNEKVYTRVIAEMEEGRKQIAANTRAVLSVLDRLEGGTGA